MCGIKGPWRHYEGNADAQTVDNFCYADSLAVSKHDRRAIRVIRVFLRPSRRTGNAGRQKNTGNSGALPSPGTLGVAYWMKLSGNVAPQ